MRLSSPSSFSLSLSLPLLILALHACINPTAARDISTKYSVTAVDLEEKNAGATVDGLSDGGEEDGTDETIRWGSTAQQRGAQLQIVTAALHAIGDVAAEQSMLSLETMAGPGDEAQSMLLAATSANLLQYHNGSVLSQVHTNPLYVNLVFYGRQWSEKDIGIVENFVKSLNPAKRGGADNRTVDRWWDISSKYYYDYKNRTVASNIVLKTSVKDASSQAPRGALKQPLTDKHMRNIVRRAVNGKKPAGANVFFVLTSPEVYVKNFGSVLCTYHSSFKLQKASIPYAFVGNPATQALSTCSYRYFDPTAQTTNGVAVDAVVNWVAHSLTKMATNPYPNRNGKKGWSVLGTGIENADLCSWDFGYTGVIQAADRKTFYAYNIKGGSLNYLIQRNFNPRIKKCVIIGHDVDDKPLPYEGL